MKVIGSYLGRSGRYAQGWEIPSNPYSDVRLNVQKSAEAIVPPILGIVGIRELKLFISSVVYFFGVNAHVF